MDDNYTAILLVLDNSGSMSGDPQGAMRSAIHAMLEEQGRKLAGYLTVDVAYFDNRIYYVEKFGDPFTTFLDYSYGGGGTMMNTAMAQGIQQFKSNIEALPENKRPGHKVVIVATDGHTSDYNDNRASILVKELTPKNWDFVYLAADQTISGAAGLGIKRENAIQHSFDKAGINKMRDKLSAFITTARGGGKASFLG